MTEAIKICPICSASNHRNATVCWNCGTSLAGIAHYNKDDTETGRKRSAYDFHHGETDLYESALYRTGQSYMFGCFGLLAAFMVIGLGLIFAPPAAEAFQSVFNAPAPEVTPTPPPRIFLPTVTQGPPTTIPTIAVIPTDTPEPTATREPCFQVVRSGDFIFDVVARCGHLSGDVFPLVAEINNLSDIGMIIEGQRLEIPWPTDIPDPNAQPQAPPQAPPQAEGEASTDSVEIASGERSILELDDDELAAFLVVPTPTLPPGIQFHTVDAGESMITIISQYSTTIESIRNLNPEITFTQCNMGETFGGDRCSVLISPGQQIRVPAPEPPPTLPPASTGLETATPTPTATFNAPILQSPADRAAFRNNQLITLRWLPTGTLGTGETYRVNVEDRTAGVLYTQDTFDTFLVIPIDWQGVNATLRRHEYAWYIDIININNPNTPSYRTPTQSFTWETRIGN